MARFTRKLTLILVADGFLVGSFWGWILRSWGNVGVILEVLAHSWGSTGWLLLILGLSGVCCVVGFRVLLQGLGSISGSTGLV